MASKFSDPGSIPGASTSENPKGFSIRGQSFVYENEPLNVQLTVCVPSLTTSAKFESPVSMLPFARLMVAVFGVRVSVVGAPVLLSVPVIMQDWPGLIVPVVPETV